MPEAPRRALTDWTTVSGLDGAGQLALVTHSASPEGIHLATLGFEVFVLHPNDHAVSEAEPAQHVHHVAGDPAGLPPEWSQRFGLVVTFDDYVPVAVLAPSGLVVAIADRQVEVAGLVTVKSELIADRPQTYRTVLARLSE